MSNRIDIITLLLNYKYIYPKYGIRKEFILLHTEPYKYIYPKYGIRKEFILLHTEP
jgi:hypothetical protein